MNREKSYGNNIKEGERNLSKFKLLTQFIFSCCAHVSGLFACSTMTTYRNFGIDALSKFEISITRFIFFNFHRLPIILPSEIPWWCWSCQKDISFSSLLTINSFSFFVFYFCYRCCYCYRLIFFLVSTKTSNRSCCH